MKKTIGGLFTNFTEAERALRDLTELGITGDNISFVAKDPTSGELHTTHADESETVVSGAATGVALGGLAGFLIAMPGIGPVLALGPLAAMIIGAAVGGAAGGFITELGALGVPEEEARFYEEAVRRGETAIIVQVEEAMVDHASAVLERYGALDMHERLPQGRRDVSEIHPA
jgi:uncharacterized membrane protein